METLTPLAGNPSAHRALAGASVLYTDLDGTLLARGGNLLADASGSPSTVAAEAVVALNRAGLTVRACSGRSRSQLLEVVRLCGWGGYVAELGCVIVRDRAEPPVYFLGDWPEETLRPDETPFEAIERTGALATLLEMFPGRIEPHTPWNAGREATHVLRGDIDVDAGAAALASLDPPVGLVDNGVIRPPRHTLVGCEEIHAYHLAPLGATKEIAVRRDLELMGMSREDAVAIGDSETDVGMAGSVSLMVLVANALEDPRAVASAAGRGNVAVTRRARGEGWAELAAVWLEAREGLTSA